MMAMGKIHPDLWEQWLCDETGWSYEQLMGTPASWLDKMSLLLSARNLTDKRAMDKANKP